MYISLLINISTEKSNTAHLSYAIPCVLSCVTTWNEVINSHDFEGSFLIQVKQGRRDTNIEIIKLAIGRLVLLSILLTWWRMFTEQEVGMLYRKVIEEVGEMGNRSTKCLH